MSRATLKHSLIIVIAIQHSGIASTLGTSLASHHFPLSPERSKKANPQRRAHRSQPIVTSQILQQEEKLVRKWL